MTYRAIVQDGLIVFNTKGAIPDGTAVEITVAGGRSRDVTRKSNRRTSKSAPASRGSTKTARVPGFGMWADRDELGSADAAVDRLRASTRRRRVD